MGNGTTRYHQGNTGTGTQELGKSRDLDLVLLHQVARHDPRVVDWIRGRRRVAEDARCAVRVHVEASLRAVVAAACVLCLRPRGWHGYKTVTRARNMPTLSTILATPMCLGCHIDAKRVRVWRAQRSGMAKMHRGANESHG